MKKVFRFLSVSSVLFMLLATNSSFSLRVGLIGDVNAATAICKWKDNKAGAFSMSFDDAMLTQVDYLIPLMISKGLVGSFCCVMGGYKYGYGIMTWESLCSRTGLDIVNHTMTHGSPVDLTEADYEMGEAHRLILPLRRPGSSKLMLFVRPGSGTYPTGWETILPQYNLVLGRGDGTQIYVGALTTQIAAVQAAINNNEWFEYHWHGVGPQAEYLFEDRGWNTADFETFLDYLVTSSSSLWVGTNTDVHKYHYEQETSAASVISSTQNASDIRLTLASSADPALYDYPLTLITDVPAGWTNCKITQGNMISIKPVNSSRAMYEAIPGWGEVKLESSGLDTTPPNAPAVVRDGTGSDVDSTVLTTQLSANWNAATDTETGISKYWYKVGTTPGGSEIFDWIDNGTFTYVTTSRTNLALSMGVTYYVTVKAVNGTGAESGSGTSDGQCVDVVPGYIKFSDDFERGNFSSEWDTLTQSGNNTIQVTSEAEYRGSYGVKCHVLDKNTAVAKKISSLNMGNDTFVKFYFKIGSNFSMPEILNNTEDKLIRLLGLYDADNNLICGFYIAYMRNSHVGSQYITALNTYIYMNDGQDGLTWVPWPPGSCIDPEDIDSGFMPITKGEWHCVDLHTKASDTKKGGIELWIDGVKRISVLRRPMSGKIVKSMDLGVDGIGDNVSGDVYFDDITVSDCLYKASFQGGDTTPPSAPASVRDGTGVDVDSINSTNPITQLSANWSPAVDSESGINKYWYAIGTIPGGTNIVNWTDNGTNMSVTKTGLTLIVGQIYYFSVKADNGVGLQGAVTSSNGQTVAAGSTGNNDSIAYPNPYSLSRPGGMKFIVSGAGGGEVKIFTITGKLVKTISAEAGTNQITWDGRNEDNEKVSKGVYIYKITPCGTNGDSIIGKLALK